MRGKSKQNGLKRDEKAVSVTVDQALGLAVLLLLNILVISGFTTAFDAREDAVVKEELERINEETVRSIHTVDTLATYGEQKAPSSDPTMNIESRGATVKSVAGDTFTTTIGYDESSNTAIVTTSRGQEEVSTTIKLDHEIESGVVQDTYEIRYDDSENEIAVSNIV